MRFGVLGATEARRDGQTLPLGGPKQRAVLAFLLLHANQPVLRDRLIDALWGDRPPSRASASLDSYISRLRKLLGADRLVRESSGYLLKVEPDALDLDRFERFVSERRFTEALDVWRGPALADIVYEPFANDAAQELEERRLLALEQRVEADLADGKSVELVPELERFVREHPLRERFIAQLMLALYVAGRQADALATHLQCQPLTAYDPFGRSVVRLPDHHARWRRHHHPACPSTCGNRRRLCSVAHDPILFSAGKHTPGDVHRT